MTEQQIIKKIQALLDAGQISNTRLALELIDSQLNSNLEEVLCKFERNYQLKENSRTGEDFYLRLQLGPVLLEYDYSKRYAPYVGSIERASRKIGIDRRGQIQYQVNMNQYWEVKEWKAEDVKALFEADYLELIPYLAQAIESETNS